MSTTITAKLNRPAREHGNNFFVDLGKKEYNYKTKQSEWVNYSAALYAKDTQVDFYRTVLVEGAIISVACTGLLIDTSYTDQQGVNRPTLSMQDAKLCFVNSDAPVNHSAPQPIQQAPQQQAPQQAPPQAPVQQAPVQQAPQQQAPPPQGQPQGAYQHQVQTHQPPTQQPPPAGPDYGDIPF